MYKWKKIIGFIILIGVHQSKNENVLQLWSKDDGCLPLNEIMSCQSFEKFCFDDLSTR